jgi:hypothetical protein
LLTLEGKRDIFWKSNLDLHADTNISPELISKFISVQ